MKCVKVLEAVFPNNKIINDNVNGNYKQRMGIFNWIKRQVLLGLQPDSETIPSCLVRVTPKDEVLRIIGKPGENKIQMVYSHFKVQRSFDLQNYCATFKYMVDELTCAGYWKDDDHRNIQSVILTGGDQLNMKENNVLGIKDRIYEVGPKQIISEYVKNSPYYKGNYANLTKYDVFQLYVVIGED